MATTPFSTEPAVYDQLIDWPTRLAREEPFYRKLFEQVKVKRVLDAACGTGRHAELFAGWGMEVEGADVNPAMIEACRERLGESDRLSWAVRSFDDPLPEPMSFDAVVCVGNSLALVQETEMVCQSMTVLLRALRPGGLLIVQVVNLQAMENGPTTWQKCRRVQYGGREHIVLKGIHRAGTYGYVDLIDIEPGEAALNPRYDAAVFIEITAEDLVTAVQNQGATDITVFGDFAETPYDYQSSPDLILVCRSSMHPV